jgi:hypothetical protein
MRFYDGCRKMCSNNALPVDHSIRFSNWRHFWATIWRIWFAVLRIFCFGPANRPMPDTVVGTTFAAITAVVHQYSVSHLPWNVTLYHKFACDSSRRIYAARFVLAGKNKDTFHLLSGIHSVNTIDQLTTKVFYWSLILDQILWFFLVLLAQRSVWTVRFRVGFDGFSLTTKR